MNCPNCGTVNPDASKFCVGCGASLAAQQPVPQAPEANVQQPVYEQPVYDQNAYVPQEAPAQKEGSKVNVGQIKDQLVETVKPIIEKVKPIFTNKKVLIGIAAGIAVFVVLSVILTILGSDTGFTQAKQYISVYNVEEGEYSVIVNNKVLSDTIESEEDFDDSDVRMNIDGKVAAILTGDDELFVVNGKKLKQVSEDVRSYQLSVGGDYIAYATRGEDDEKTALSLYQVSNGKTNEITDDLGGSYRISPDGKSVAYFETDDDETELMLYKGKKSSGITDDKNTSLLGLSNNGKFIYVTVKDEEKDERILYAYDTKGEREKLGTYDGSYMFNEDHTQILFTNEDGKSYISSKGKEAVKVSSSTMYLLMPQGCNSYFADGSTYPVDDLFDNTYITDISFDEDYNYSCELWLIKKNTDKSVKLASDVSDATLDESCEYIYYVKDHKKLCVAKIADGERASDRAKTLVNDPIDSFVVTSDRKLVYYVDGDTLYSVSGKSASTPKRINDDLEDGASVYITEKDVALYIVDDDLHACTNGKKGKKVLSDVEGVIPAPNGFVYAGNEDTIYVSNGSKKFKKLLDLD